MEPTEERRRLGQSIWLDNITRSLLTSGTLERYIRELSVTGLTSNPGTFNRAIRETGDYDDAIHVERQLSQTTEKLFFELALSDLTQAADLFLPIHTATHGEDGWVSLEVSPLLADDPVKTVSAAKKLFAAAGRPNLFITIPGTPKGLIAVEEAIFAGIPVNVTLLFSRDQYMKSAGSYMRGIDRRAKAGLDPVVHSVASIFISRWDEAVAGREPRGLQDSLGMAVAMQSYKSYREVLKSAQWLGLADRGAVAQRLLWASSGANAIASSHAFSVSRLAAPGTVSSMPEAALLTLAGQGLVSQALPPGGGDCEIVLERFAHGGFDTAKLAGQLQREGAAAFVKSWKDLLLCIESKAQAVPAGVGD